MVTLTLKPWFIRQTNNPYDEHGRPAQRKPLYSRSITGKIIRETPKAILFRGSATTTPNENCHNCGRKITNPISVYVGYGPICSENLGIPREFSKDDVEEIRRVVGEKSRWEGWIPKSQIKEKIECQMELQMHYDV